MNESLLDRVQIQIPCQTDWGSMQGDDRVRHCAQCDKHVYNLSQMTRQQAEALLAKTNGNFCARFERRPDGSILTNDPSFGLPRFQARFLRFAAATMSAALSLSPTVVAKTPRNVPVLQQQDKREKESLSQDKEATAIIAGKIETPHRERVRFAVVRLIAMETGSEQAKPFMTGSYEFAGITPGQYKVIVLTPGLSTFSSDSLTIMAGQSVQFNILLKYQEMTEMGTVSVETHAQRIRRNIKRVFSTSFQKLKNSFNR